MNVKPPSFPKDLGRAHAGVREDLGKLEEAAAALAGGQASHLLSCLATTLAHLPAHFQFEEQGGYMAEVLKREPRLERQAQSLLEEHQQLLESLEGLVKEAKKGQGLTGPFQAKVLAWTAKVREHESKENNLVEDAFNLDLGAED